MHALEAFLELGVADSDAACKKNIVAVLDIVSSKLGNTRTVCKKYYVHPGLIRLYEEGKLEAGNVATSIETHLLRLLSKL
jgi:DNA topoisomerase-1